MLDEMNERGAKRRRIENLLERPSSSNGYRTAVNDDNDDIDKVKTDNLTGNHVEMFARQGICTGMETYTGFKSFENCTTLKTTPS